MRPDDSAIVNSPMGDSGPMTEESGPVDDRGRSGMDRRDRTVSRRAFTATAGGIAAAVTAGCVGFIEDGDDTGDDGAPAVSDAVENRLEVMDRETKVWQLLQTDLTTLTFNGPTARGDLDPAWLSGLVDEAGLGSVLTGGGSAPVPNSARGWARTANRLQSEARTGAARTPLVYGTDAVHGHANLADATVFPHNLGLGATWDPSLVRRIRERTAEALRATGVHWNFDPVCDLARDHRWGRYYECFGEDPVLVASMASAAVTGSQGGAGPPGSDGVAATPKHFVGYSRPRAGLDRNPAQLSWRRLRSQHLPAFAAAIEAGAETVMLNSGSVDGVPSHASATLVRDLLRDELGFDGVVITDWDDAQRLRSIHGVGESLQDAVGLVLEAGADVFMVGTRTDLVSEAMLGLLEDGEVSEERIDRSVRRVLRLKERLGLFEESSVPAGATAEQAVGASEGLAREAAAASLTLLRNRELLPLSGAEDVLVTGPGADDPAMQLGGWTIGWQGVPADRETPSTTTVLDGLRATVDGDVAHAPWARQGGGDLEAARAAAADADVAVAVVGEGPYAEGEGDDQRAVLAEDQTRLLRGLADTGTPVVAVVLAGRPLGVKAVQPHLDGLLMAYLPGAEGGTAIAEALVGDTPPAGRLPVTWPEHGGQAPTYYNAVPGGGDAEPTYAFGDGETYSTVQTDIPELSRSTVTEPGLDETVTASVEVTNAGDRATDRILLAMGEREYAPGPEQFPQRTVLGFERLSLEPGQVRTVEISCSLGALATVGGDVEGDGARTVAPGEYDVRVGDWQATLAVE